MKEKQINSQYVFLFFLFLTISVSVYIISLCGHNEAVGFLSDDAIFLMLAEIYSPWYSAQLPVFDFLLQHNRFPPLYPLLLGLFGVDSDSFYLASLFTVIFFNLSLIAIYFWLRRNQQTRLHSILTLFILVLLPSTHIFIYELWSEFLYILLVYCIFFMISKSEINFQQWLLISLLVALSILSKAIGVTLLIAYAFEVLYRKPKKFLLLILVALSPLLINLFISINNTRSYPAEFVQYFGQVRMDDYLYILSDRFEILFQAFVWQFGVFRLESISYLTYLIYIPLIILFMYALCIRLKEMKIDSIYTLLFISVIILWPYDDIHYVSRFIYPLMPLYFFYNLIAIQTISKHFFSNGKLFYLYFIVVLCLLLPAMLEIASKQNYLDGTALEKYSTNREWVLSKDRHFAIHNLEKQKYTLEFLREIKLHIPANECVLGIQSPLIMLHSKRISGVLPEAAATDDEFFRITDLCNFIISFNFSDIEEKYPAFYPMDRIKNKDKYVYRPKYLSDDVNKPAVAYLAEKQK